MREEVRMSSRSIKTIVICVLLLFICSAVFPSVSVVSNEIETNETYNDQDEKVVTCFVFDKTGNSEREVVLSPEDFDRFYTLFRKLNYMISYEPFNSEIEDLKIEFAGLLDSLDMIPEDKTVDDVISLISPTFSRKSSFLSKAPSPVTKPRGYAFFCNFATWGVGSQFPIIILPRLIPILLIPIPRVMMHWSASEGVTSCGGLLTGRGFIAGGEQTGTSIGFWGIGFSIFLPPIMEFGFFGFSLFCTAKADVIYQWPFY